MTAYGIELSGGVFMAGTIGAVGNRIELTISSEDAADHILDLMDPEKTKWIKFYSGQLMEEYDGYSFSYMQKDTVQNKVNVWMEKKGE